MEPQRPIFRRRHFDNPAVFNILITNYIVAAFGLVIFDSNHHVNWFFWVVMGVLGVYNVFSLYKNREELNKNSYRSLCHRSWQVWAYYF